MVQVLNIPRAVWTQVFTGAMARVAQEQQMLQMQHEYTLLLEGGHGELAEEFGETMLQFAKDKALSIGDLADQLEAGRRHRRRRSSVTKVISRDELRAKKRRASVCELDLQATELRTKHQSAADNASRDRTRRKSVTENLISKSEKNCRPHRCCHISL